MIEIYFNKIQFKCNVFNTIYNLFSNVFILPNVIQSRFVYYHIYIFFVELQKYAFNTGFLIY